MITSEVLSNMSIQEIAQAIEAHHQESNLLYEALGGKIIRKTEGDGFLGDEKFATAEYWLKIAKEHRKILAMDFNLVGFEEAVIGFEFMVDYAKSNGSLTVYLKTARDKASKDCAFFCSVVRKRVKELEKDPIYALVLSNEPNPRKVTEKSTDKAATKPQPATT